MANIPTPEENARHVLTIFRGHGVRAGEMLMQQNFMPSKAWSADDIAHGLKFAIGCGWVEFKNTHFFLTEAGFKEI
ncbi:hypothetical protein [Methylocella silvestris]|uniref:hypothetical protein n=1 Tax=Methylocella silvestris TaxID=199596 RepID=UPI0011AF081A|nr:hypothetical protein [Methylocella silvestris]